MSPDDPRWIRLVYATVLVPVVGQPLVVVASSILYYRWRNRWPKAAFQLNVHAWIAVALNIGLTFLFYVSCAGEALAARLARAAPVCRPALRSLRLRRVDPVARTMAGLALMRVKGNPSTSDVVGGVAQKTAL